MISHVYNSFDPLHLKVPFFSSLFELGSKQIQNVLLDRRVLMSFKENPPGSNLTFECTPSGPCLHSDKGDEKYRCIETGYRIPMICVEIKDSTKDTKRTNS